MSTKERRPVVVGVDGTEGSAGALRYGVHEAVGRDTSLRLVHVAPSYPPMGLLGPVAPVGLMDIRAIGSSILDAAARTAAELAPDLELTTGLEIGSRSAGLVAEAEGAQLVVVGRETRRGIDRILTGATTAAVAAHARCDVVVVPAPWTADHPRGRVVAGVKTQANAHELLGRAFAAARTRGATLTLVTAWELPDPYLDRIELRTHEADWEASGIETLEALVADWRTEYADVPVELRIVHGRAADVLLEMARESDLLLLSRRRRAIPPHGHLGGTPRALLRVSEVPVEIVPFAAPG